MATDNKNLVNLIENLDKKEKITAIVLGVKKGLLISNKYKKIYDLESESLKIIREVRHTQEELKDKYQNPRFGVLELEFEQHYYEAALLCETTDKKGFDRRAMKDYAIAGDYRRAFSKAQKANEPAKTKIYQSLDKILGSDL